MKVWETLIQLFPVDLRNDAHYGNDTRLFCAKHSTRFITPPLECWANSLHSHYRSEIQQPADSCANTPVGYTHTFLRRGIFWLSAMQIWTFRWCLCWSSGCEFNISGRHLLSTEHKIHKMVTTDKFVIINCSTTSTWMARLHLNSISLGF